MAKKIPIFILLILIFSNVCYASNDDKIEDYLEDIIVNEPNRNVVVVISLETDNEGLLDEIREATEKVDGKIKSITDRSKERFRALKEELGYYEDKEEVLKF